MNTQNTRTPVETVNNVIAFAAKARRSYGERGFGTGYGNSSGYAADKRYTSASQMLATADPLRLTPSQPTWRHATPVGHSPAPSGFPP